MRLDADFIVLDSPVDSNEEVRLTVEKVFPPNGNFQRRAFLPKSLYAFNSVKLVIIRGFKVRLEEKGKRISRSEWSEQGGCQSSGQGKCRKQSPFPHRPVYKLLFIYLFTYLPVNIYFVLQTSSLIRYKQ